MGMKKLSVRMWQEREREREEERGRVGELRERERERWVFFLLSFFIIFFRETKKHNLNE